MPKKQYTEIINNLKGSGRLKDSSSPLSQKIGHAVKPSTGGNHKPITEASVRSEMKTIKSELS